MAEPWEIKSDDSRSTNTLTTFIIFCEDELCEPFYFRAFEKENKNIKVNTVENQRAGKLNLNATIKYCADRGMMDTVDHSYVLKQDVTENIWCVYDRDLENEDLTLIEEVHDIDFTTAVRAAENSRLKVAWSNDAFELWILLHFEAVPVGQRLHRRYIYERLTEIFKALDPQSPELKAIASHALFNYKDWMKRKGKFLVHVLPLLRDRRATAIANAQALEAGFAGGIPYHNCNPGTKVHHLVSAMMANA